MLLLWTLVFAAAQIHLLSAVGTVNHSCERIDRLHFLRSALVFAKLLHQIESLLRDNMLLRILEDLPLVLRIVDDLMHLVGLHFRPEIDRVTAVFIAFKDMGNCLRSPAISLSIMPSVVTTLR